MHNGSVTAKDSGPGAVTVRAGTAGDVDEVVGFWTAAGAHPTSTDDGPSVAGVVGRDPGALLIAEIDGEMVGTLIATWDGWRGNMYRLAVRPDLRRRRIAATLVAEGERRLRALGCRRVSALVVGRDLHAVDFWTHVGYSPYPMERYVHTLGDSAPGAVGAGPPAPPTG
jgi:ribosomal protein S18 acetylase RimI-like enzyme